MKVAKLTDYLDIATLQQLQDSFSAVAQGTIRVVGKDGAPLTKTKDAYVPEDAEAGYQRCEVPVVIGGEVLGSLELHVSDEEGKAGDPRRGSDFLSLMGSVISRLWDREKELHARVDELGVLYRLSAEFSSQRDLQSVLDLVAKTVVEVLKARGCSIRLLSEDGTELVVKAVANLSREYLNKGPILLSESKIDREVISTEQMVYIPDERTDPRVLYPTEARREGIVSALCAPLIYKGRPEGVIRVYMSELHEFDWFEGSLLHAVAVEAATGIVNARLFAEAERSANMKRALQMAAEVQRRMIPAHPPEIPGLQVGAMYVPTFELGGDFYDFIDLPPDNVGIAVCDVAGKGVRASLLMASIRAALRAHAVNIYGMSEVLRRVNRDLCAATLSSDFATLFYSVLDADTHRFTYSNAGHPPPILFRGDEVRRLTAGGGLIGVDPDMSWSYDSFTLEKSDVIFMYTDGLTEAMNFDAEMFGQQRVVQSASFAIREDFSAEAIAKHVLWEMRKFAGLQTRLDDVTLVTIKMR